MALSHRRVDVLTLVVEDLERSREFYRDVFGLPVTFEDGESAVFTFENLLINLLAVEAAGDLMEPGAVAGPGAGSRFLLTIRVDDVDAMCTELAARGVPLLNGPVDRAWGVRTASFADPAGHVWEIAQDLPSPQGA